MGRILNKEAILEQIDIDITEAGQKMIKDGANDIDVKIYEMELTKLLSARDYITNLK